MEAPAGADLSVKTDRDAYLHRTMYYAPCGHSVQAAGKAARPARRADARRAGKEIGGLYENAAVTELSRRRGGREHAHGRYPARCIGSCGRGTTNLLAVLQNTTGETLTVVRRTDIPVALAAGGGAGRASRRRMFDDVQALEDIWKV